MGAFFGSVYTRGVDPATVQSVLAKVAKRLGCCFLMAPEIDGWIGIYPSNDQDATVARHIHQHLKADVLQVILHDSDVFCYQYHRDGKLVDEFNSRPDYFEEATARKRQTLRSKPETLATLLRHPDDLDRLRELLRPEDPEDLSDGDAILEGFAKLLGLPGCNTSYGYLMQEADDGEEMERRDEFIHVPDLSAQQGQRAAARAAASAELDRFGREGLLLFDQSPAPRPPCPDPRGQGFLIWDADTWDGDREVHRVSEPWSGGLAPAGIVVERGSSVAVSPSGRYFVLSSSSGSTLLDAATNSSLLNVSGAFAGFTPDENVMITLGQGVRLFSIPDGELIRTIGGSIPAMEFMRYTRPARFCWPPETSRH
jgi:hypothetical protein